MPDWIGTRAAVLSAWLDALDLFAGAGGGGGLPLDLHPIPPREDVDAQPVFERDQILVVFPEHAPQQLGLVEHDLDAALVTEGGGLWLSAQMVILLRVTDKKFTYITHSAAVMQRHAWGQMMTASRRVGQGEKHALPGPSV